MNRYVENKISSNGKFKKSIEYEDGKKIKVYNYKFNKLHGDLIEYDKDGRILKSYIYESGEKNGICKEYIYEIDEVIYLTYKKGKLVNEETKSISAESYNKENMLFALLKKYFSLGEVFGYFMITLMVIFFISVMKWLKIF